MYLVAWIGHRHQDQRPHEALGKEGKGGLFFFVQMTSHCLLFNTQNCLKVFVSQCSWDLSTTNIWWNCSLLSLMCNTILYVIINIQYIYSPIAQSLRLSHHHQFNHNHTGQQFTLYTVILLLRQDCVTLPVKNRPRLFRFLLIYGYFNGQFHKDKINQPSANAVIFSLK